VPPDQTNPRNRYDLEAGLTGLAHRLEPGGTGVANLARLSAGATQELWRFDVVAGHRLVPMIVRRPPDGDRVREGAMSMAVEAQLIVAARAIGVPAPPVRHVFTPEDRVGLGFIMDFIEGETLGGRIVKSPALADARTFLAHQCGEVLARIHDMDPEPFPTLNRVATAGLLEQWRERYLSSNWPRPVFDLTFRWLSQIIPQPADHVRLVHGDYRNGNLIIGQDGLRAVLDWEGAHVGDPMEDLGYICVNSWRFGIEDKPVGGFGQREDFYAGYEAAGGARVNRAASHWWEVFATLRWGVICCVMAESFRTVDPTIERAVIARRTSETEVDLMRLLDA
jgi:aminoglycoside phosphotransferase (APT) family kinase protein